MDEQEGLPAKKGMPRWLVGCLVAGGVVLFLFVGTAGACFVMLRNSVKGFETASQSRQQLDQQFGEPGAFTPAPDGAVPEARMEIFLHVREATQPARLDIVRRFGDLPLSDDEAKELENKPFTDKLISVLSIGKTALGLPGALGALFDARNQALLDGGMGFGEYTYIYDVAYYAYLGHDPGEGVGSKRVRTTIEDDEGNRVVHEDPGDRRLRQRIHGDLLSMLKNQLGSLPGGLSEEKASVMRTALEAEIAEMEKDPTRAAWLDTLPGPIRASLEPFKDRLESTYSKMTNEFELGRNRKTGSMSYTSD